MATRLDAYPVGGDEVGVEADEVALQLDQLVHVLDRLHVVGERLDDVTDEMQRRADVIAVDVRVAVVCEQTCQISGEIRILGDELVMPCTRG